jgi:hypothetical protein
MPHIVMIARISNTAKKVGMPHIELELNAVFPKTQTYALSLFLFSRITLDIS